LRWRAGRPFGRPREHRGGFREDLGFSVRSSYEANVARYLKWMVEVGALLRWEYEPERFWFCAEPPGFRPRCDGPKDLFPAQEFLRKRRLAGVVHGHRWYVPDFKLIEREDEPAYYWEVKGWFDDPSRVRLERMALYWPGVRVVLVDSAAYRILKQRARPVCPAWE